MSDSLEEQVEKRERKELEKKFWKQFKMELTIAFIALILVGMIYLIFINLDFNDPLTKVCGTVDHNEISFNYYQELQDGMLICVFDNHLPPYINIDENTQKTNPNYKVCYKLMNQNKQGEYEEAGITC
jgi:hypothetical protein